MWKALNCVCMRLLSLQLENFRNYDLLDLDFSKSQVTALIGANAQGKTNIIEAIAFLALGKSFRTHHSMETLGWEKPHGRVKGFVSEKSSGGSNENQLELEVFFQRSPEIKKVKLQSQVVAPKAFLGNLRVVIFTPDHLQLISGSPSLRRQYLDRTLVQLDRNYVDAITNFQRILKQRNNLLKKIQLRNANEWELDMWDARLVTESQKIWEKRKIFVKFLTQEVPKIYKEISGQNQELTIKYSTDENRYDEKLTAAREYDTRTGATSVGPHRDDFHLFLDSKDLAEFGSRGECRSAILALKIAEIHYIESESGQKPLLLLDDVFSELDSNRQIHLGNLLEGYQAVITTTCTDHICGLQSAQIYEVNSGVLMEVQS